MKIKEGKKYILRDGTVTGKLVLLPQNDPYLFKCMKIGMSFRLDGTYIDDAIKHLHDIVAKYKKRKKQNHTKQIKRGINENN